MSQPRYVRIVSLWIHPGQEAAFEAFEREAARIMARHGGWIDSAVRTGSAGPTGGGAEDSPRSISSVFRIAPQPIPLPQTPKP